MKKILKIGILVVILIGVVIYYIDSKTIYDEHTNTEGVKISSVFKKEISQKDDTLEASLADDQYEEYNEDEYIYETEVDGPDECSSYEEFDPKNSTCFFVCESENECKEIEEEINKELDDWANEYDGYQSNQEESEPDASKSVAKYSVLKGEAIKLRSGKDSLANKKIWDEIAVLSPNVISDTYIETFEIINDPASDSIAYVSDDDENGKWNIAVNEGVRKGLSLQEQKMTLIHELGHIITLNHKQVIPGEKCRGLALTEGCAKPESYVQKFVTQFWSGKKLPYSSKNYVTEYAASENVEDLAESWAMFVIDKTNTNPVTVAEKKVAFFKQFPELLKIREDMRGVLSRDIVRARKLHNN